MIEFQLQEGFLLMAKRAHRPIGIKLHMMSKVWLWSLTLKGSFYGDKKSTNFKSNALRGQ